MQSTVVAYDPNATSSRCPAAGANSIVDYLNAAVATVAGGDVGLVYLSACGPTTGMALLAILIISTFFAGISSLTVTSRIAFAMARDGAFPYSAWIRPVWQATKSPIGTVVLVFGLDAVILLIQLGSAKALGAILSITVIGYQISYAIPLILRVIYREQFVQGAFSLGIFSLPIHIAASAWLGGCAAGGEETLRCLSGQRCSFVDAGVISAASTPSLFRD